MRVASSSNRQDCAGDPEQPSRDPLRQRVHRLHTRGLHRGSDVLSFSGKGVQVHAAGESHRHPLPRLLKVAHVHSLRLLGLYARSERLGSRSLLRWLRVVALISRVHQPLSLRPLRPLLRPAAPLQQHGPSVPSRWNCFPLSRSSPTETPSCCTSCSPPSSAATRRRAFSPTRSAQSILQALPLSQV